MPYLSGIHYMGPMTYLKIRTLVRRPWMIFSWAQRGFLKGVAAFRVSEIGTLSLESVHGFCVMFSG